MSSSPPPSFYCTLCKRDDRLEPSWVHHLASLGHQRALTRCPQGGHGTWGVDTEVKSRAMEVVGCQQLTASPIDLANYLTKFGGTLEEFICPTSLSGTKPNVVSCLFKTVDSVEKLLGVEEHKLFRQPIQIRRKYESQEEAKQSAVKNGNLCDDDVTDSGFLDSETTLEKNGLNGHLGTPSSLETRKRKRRHRTEKKVYPKLEDQLVELHKFHNPELRAKIVKELLKLVAATFNQCGIYSYGLDYIGVSLDSDELRLCIDPYGKFAAKSVLIIRNPSDPMACGLICQILSTSKDSDGCPKFTFVSQYSTSNVTDIPEISFKQSVNQVLVPCKIQFENFLSVQKSRLLRFLTNHDDRVASIFSLIRLWSKKHEVLHELREGEEFEGYILIMMMVFHLTKNKFLPSLAQLRELAIKNGPSLVLDNMDVAYCVNRKLVPPARVPSDKNLRALTIIQTLQTFFQFFAEFKFSKDVVCPSIGEILKKGDFRPQMEKNLPPQILKYYKTNADGTLREAKLAIFSPVVVQDILDLTDNVARAVDESDLALFQLKCGKTSKFLETLLNKGTGNLMKQFGIKALDEDDIESSSEDEEDIRNAVEVPAPPSPLYFCESPRSPLLPTGSLSDKLSNSSTSGSGCRSLHSPPPSPGPPPLLPPPAPFQMAGMPLIPTSTINSNSTPKRTILGSGRRVPPPPPPPKIGGLLPTPPKISALLPTLPKSRGLLSTPRTHASEQYVSPYAAERARESVTRILRDPRGDQDKDKSPEVRPPFRSKRNEKKISEFPGQKDYW